MPIDRMSLPCWSCRRPEADDARRWLGSASEDDIVHHRSPMGWPPGCCHVRVVGVLPRTDASDAAPGRR
jgi:hypothetical protein